MKFDTDMANDPRIDELVRDVAQLKGLLAENTVITHQVRDVLTSFRVIASVAKWLTAVGAVVLAVLHAPEAIRAFIRHQ